MLFSISPTKVPQSQDKDKSLSPFSKGQNKVIRHSKSCLLIILAREVLRAWMLVEDATPLVCALWRDAPCWDPCWLGTVVLRGLLPVLGAKPPGFGSLFFCCLAHRSFHSSLRSLFSLPVSGRARNRSVISKVPFTLSPLGKAAPQIQGLDLHRPCFCPV